jgi:hypothetical protein
MSLKTPAGMSRCRMMLWGERISLSRVYLDSVSKVRFDR